MNLLYFQSKVEDNAEGEYQHGSITTKDGQKDWPELDVILCNEDFDCSCRRAGWPMAHNDDDVMMTMIVVILYIYLS